MTNYAWHVEGSLPPEPDKHYRRNFNATVIAPTLMGAVAAVLTKYPGIELVKVWPTI